MKTIALGLIISLMATGAWAITLDAAKAQGLVGERNDGYIGAVQSNASADVLALVDDINAKRKAEYQRISNQNGQPVSVIEKLAAAKAFEKTPKGYKLMNSQGMWVDK